MEAMILAFMRLVEARDPYTAGHQQKVAKLSKAIAEELGLEKVRVEGINMAAAIHDIGKLYVPVARIIHQHHERMNGSGYPLGLKGDHILLEARIIAVADVVEAMSSHRPYRPALGLEEALGEISKNKGVLYDPDVADICQRLFEAEAFAFEE
ncbi:MAG: HD domain-containing protein [Deltaproteobacteria bacterium]|nr:HD domain-containing protein [Deltaproteobacteria bacterium]